MATGLRFLTQFAPLLDKLIKRIGRDSRMAPLKTLTATRAIFPAALDKVERLYQINLLCIQRADRLVITTDNPLQPLLCPLQRLLPLRRLPLPGSLSEGFL